MVHTKERFTASLEDASLGDSVDRMKNVGDIGQQVTSPDWLGMAKNAFLDSDRYFESSIRWQFERNIAFMVNVWKTLRRPPPASWFMQALWLFGTVLETTSQRPIFGRPGMTVCVTPPPSLMEVDGVITWELMSPGMVSVTKGTKLDGGSDGTV